MQSIEPGEHLAWHFVNDMLVDRMARRIVWPVSLTQRNRIGSS
jgi:hypothetical protein